MISSGCDIFALRFRIISCSFVSQLCMESLGQILGIDSSILPARVANQSEIRFILPAHGACHIIIIDINRLHAS